jgi:hypothetical protein
MSSATATAATASPYRQTIRNMDISVIAVWPFYLIKKESLNFYCGEA